jgi:hypothetical protein
MLNLNQFYDFFIVNDGIDNRTSMLRTDSRKRRSTQASKSTKINSETEKKDDKAAQATDATLEKLTTSMSSLRFVPRSVKFGKGRAGFAKS